MTVPKVRADLIVLGRDCSLLITTHVNVLQQGSMNTERSLKFGDGIVLSPAYTARLGWGLELIEWNLEFVKKLQDIKLDPTEFAILCAMVLMYPDAPGLEEKICVAEIQTRMLECLHFYLNELYPTNIHLQRFSKLLFFLPHLRSVSCMAEEQFLAMAKDGRVELNELIKEMIS